MKKLVVLTGAGISAECGLGVFRGAGGNGLWENEDVMAVASADGFRQNPARVHEFYNMRRKQLVEAEPGIAHYTLKDLEKDFDVQIITQNVDDLHERAGSTNVLHLHGELMKIRSMKNPDRIYTLKAPDLSTSVDTRDEYGDPVRPHIVFFQEEVPNIVKAAEIVQEADILAVIGSSLVVYPAAGLINYARRGTPIYYVDPEPVALMNNRYNVNYISKFASIGVPEMAEKMRKIK